MIGVKSIADRTKALGRRADAVAARSDAAGSDMGWARRGIQARDLDKANAKGTHSVFWVRKNGNHSLHKEQSGRSVFSEDEAERIRARLQGLNPTANVIVKKS
jgi:hypothetical protein